MGRGVLVLQVANEGSLSIDNLRAQLDPNKLHFFPGGGLGSFGANFSVFSYQDTIIWIDYGAGFPNKKTPGMARSLPDMAITKAMIPDAIILTHSHEDHIGGIPYIISLLPIKTNVYCSIFTKEILQNKLSDSGLDPNYFEYHILTENNKHKIKDIEFFNFFIPHSVPQAYSVGLKLPNDIKIYFTSDFKLEGHEPNFVEKDIKEFAPVDLLFADSTGALKNGKSLSEENVLLNIKELIAHTSGRIFITTFSSQVERIKGIYKIAKELSRPFGIQGFSIKNHLKAAYNAGVFDEMPSKISHVSPKSKNAIWIIAGCQAEEGSSLYKLAHNQFGRFTLSSNDTLLFSGSIIPGNEEGIFSVLNKISELGVRVIGIGESTSWPNNAPPFHASGHGQGGDIATLIEWLQPKNIVPVHGDALHFNAFENIVNKVYAQANVHFAYSGSIYSFYKNKNGDGVIAKVLDKPFGPAFIESGEIHFDMNLYERRLELSTYGLCIVVLEEASGALLNFELVGVVSQSKMSDEEKGTLHFELENICNHISHLSKKQRHRKVRQNIKMLLLSRYSKKPFIQVIEV